MERNRGVGEQGRPRRRYSERPGEKHEKADHSGSACMANMDSRLTDNLRMASKEANMMAGSLPTLPRYEV
jgi:hypothetical protein